MLCITFQEATFLDFYKYATLLVKKYQFSQLPSSAIDTVLSFDVCSKGSISKGTKIEYGEFYFSCNLFQKVKFSYILDSLHVK